ncbi:hypothetical protein [Aurantimonas coralicida]|uniref:hypothetical protein n=1 Tax=Aurantimonas coralicida TaxID=182270 RepID=UPI001D184020|nr:hypothetical protein [Aurantimonas coralicida]MCC4300204.1 hypothetical protein [Aurantimonas coralicida]
MPITFVVGKVPDSSLIATFDALSSEFEQGNWSLQAGDIDLTPILADLRMRKAVSHMIERASITVDNNNFVVRFCRGMGGHPSPHYDEFQLEPRPNRNPSPATLIRIEDVIRSKIKFPTPSLSSKTQEQVAGLLEKEMSTLASMHHQLLADALSVRTQYEEQETERRAAFEKEQQEAQAVLRREEEASKARIAHEQSVLDERLKEFDFSDHMRARRKLREDITTQVREFLKRPASSTMSDMKFYFVISFCAMAAGVSGLLAYESFQSFISLAGRATDEYLALVRSVASQASVDAAELGPATQTSTVPSVDNTYLLWMLGVRGALLSAVAVGFMAYLVSMIRKSHDEDVRTLREFQRYGMDINRASWVIETAMEMTTKEGATLPDRWVEGACAGLFQSGSGKEGEVSSLAALGAVMGLGPEVAIGPEGASFKIPPRAAKKAANEAV